MSIVSRKSSDPWRKCILCHGAVFKTSQDFRSHIRQFHCKKEGGSYVCCYGRNDVCYSLPLEGVSEHDYEFHVIRQHISSSLDDGSQGEASRRKPFCQKYQHLIPPNRRDQQPNVILAEYKWTIYDSTLILPNILNDPRSVKRDDLFTKEWGDSFIANAAVPSSSYVCSIDIHSFELYLRHAKKYMQHQRYQTKMTQSKKPCDQQSDTSSCQSHLTLAAGDNSNVIGAVPKVFMQNEFNLSDPQIFDAVLPWTQLYGSQTSEKSVQPRNSVKLLHEQLSHYLDSVEVEIAKQISVRSEAFFNAMTSHDALMEDLTEVIQSVCALRKRIYAIQDEEVKAPMNVLRVKMRQGNYILVYNKLKLMATIHLTQPTIQLLLQTSDFVGALDLISTTQEILVQELAGIHCFRHLSSQLAELEKLIGTMMQTDFLRYVTADLNRPPTETCVMEEERVLAILFGMLRLNNFRFLQTYKDECYTAIDTAVKQSVIEIISEADDFDVENNTGNLTEQLHSLNFMQWLDLVKSVLKSLTFLLSRIKALYLIIDKATDYAAGQTGNVENRSTETQQFQVTESEIDIKISEQDYLKLKTDLKDLIGAVCDHAHDACAEIFTTKAKDGSLDKITTVDFVLLAQKVEQFHEDCESICGRQSTPLRLAIISQASRFLYRFHEERKTKLSLLLENEQWRQADVPIEFQELVDHIVKTGAVTSPKKTPSSLNSSIGRKPSAYIIVHNEKFTVVGTVLMLLRMIIEYCQCAEDVPTLAYELGSRLAELLNSFHSKTYKLVMCAGALGIIDTKTITTKHLALTSRCLKFITYFLPQVKNHFCTKVPSKQETITKHFDHLLQNYCVHINDISGKMEEIISLMFESELKQYKVKAPVPSACFKSICKQISKFHEVLVDSMPPQDLASIMHRVNEIFTAKLRGRLMSLDITSQHGLVTQELTFYTQKLKVLNSDFNFNVNDVWSER